MRLRRRYQEGGRTANLLAALEKRRVMNQLNSSKGERMPEPSTAPASSTGVYMAPPNRSGLMGLDHPSFRPQKTISQESVNYEDPANIFKMIGAPIQTAAAMNKMVQSGEFRRPTTAEIEATGSRAMDLPFAMTPLGDAADILGAESGLDFAMAAGLAFVPGNAKMLKNALPDFVRMPDIKPMTQLLGAIDEAGDVGDAILSNAEGLVKMSPSARARLSEGLEELAQGNAKKLDPSEYSRLKEAADFIKNPSKQTISGPPPSIGSFKLNKEAGEISYRNYDNNDFISLAKQGDDYTIVGLMDNTSPAKRGRMMVEIIKEVPKGAKVKFGSVNDLSSDSYVFPIKYIENGKAKLSPESVEYLPLNDFGGTPKPFADLFGIEEYEVGLVDGTASFQPTDEMFSSIKTKIDSKLESIGLPASRVGDEFEILMPHFDMIKQVGKGEFRYGGNLKMVKQSRRGFRTKR